MRFRIVIAAIGLATGLSAGTARAADQGSGFYFAGKGGPTLSSVSGIASDTGRTLREDSGSNLIGNFGMAGGYTWSHQGLPLRTELELMNRTEVSYNVAPLFAGGGANDTVGSDVQNVTLMAKGYWHFLPDNTRWSPFLSAGLGVSRTTVKGQYAPAGAQPVKLDEAGYDLAWSAGAGASFYLGNRVVNDVELSYVDLGSVDWGLPTGRNLKSDSFSSVQLVFAIRMNF